MEASSTYRYETYSFKIITPLIALISLAFLLNGAFIAGSILMLIAALSAISFRGVIIDRENQKYMKYDRFLNVRIGKWDSLSKPSYVTVVRINLSDRRIGPAPMVMPEDKKGAKAYKVNLVVEGDERYIPVCRGPLEKMTREALRLGEHLHVRVLDYSTHEKKWIL
jgi:hypothetical protein